MEGLLSARINIFQNRSLAYTVNAEKTTAHHFLRVRRLLLNTRYLSQINLLVFSEIDVFYHEIILRFVIKVGMKTLLCFSIMITISQEICRPK